MIIKNKFKFNFTTATISHIFHIHHWIFVYKNICKLLKICMKKFIVSRVSEKILSVECGWKIMRMEIFYYFLDSKKPLENIKFSIWSVKFLTRFFFVLVVMEISKMKWSRYEKYSKNPTTHLNNFHLILLCVVFWSFLWGLWFFLGEILELFEWLCDNLFY